MNSIEAAKRVQKGMGEYAYHIYWDRKYQCFRVMRADSRAFLKYGHDNYEQIHAQEFSGEFFDTSKTVTYVRTELRNNYKG